MILLKKDVANILLYSIGVILDYLYAVKLDAFSPYRFKLGTLKIKI